MKILINYKKWCRLKNVGNFFEKDIKKLFENLRLNLFIIDLDYEKDIELHKIV